MRVLHPPRCLDWWPAGAILLLGLVPAVVEGSEATDRTTRLDCGVNALYVLMRLQGLPVTVDRILAALPARHPDGYSMAELADASRSLGLGLDGVRFGKGERKLDRPAIAFLNDEKGGHFVVLRPVGTTGTMVQVIDPPLVPWIADYDLVLKSRPWTGRILIPSDPWPWRSVLAATIALACLTILIGSIRNRLRLRSSALIRPRPPARRRA